MEKFCETLQPCILVDKAVVRSSFYCLFFLKKSYYAKHTYAEKIPFYKMN